MALVPKIDPNKIFASNAPTQDKPAAFDNYEKGMDETRKNLGRPTIKQSNYLHQTADQKILWIHQNGGGLPYDASIEYAENAVTLKDGELKQLVDGAWVEVKTKSLPATAITTASAQNQQQINDFGGAKWYAKVSGYDLGATVKLDNGDTVKSTTPKNTNDPNVNMDGWFPEISSSVVFFITPEMFGAVGGNLAKDQSAFDKMIALGSGQTWQLKSGREYHVTNVTPPANTIIYANWAKLKKASNDNQNVLNLYNPYNKVYNIEIDGNKSGTTTTGFGIRSLGNFNDIQGFYVHDTGQYGVVFANCENSTIKNGRSNNNGVWATDGSTKADGIYFSNTKNCVAENCKTTGNGRTGLVQTSYADDGIKPELCHNNSFINCQSSDNAYSDVNTEGVSKPTFKNLIIKGGISFSRSNDAFLDDVECGLLYATETIRPNIKKLKIKHRGVRATTDNFYLNGHDITIGTVEIDNTNAPTLSGISFQVVDSGTSNIDNVKINRAANAVNIQSTVAESILNINVATATGYKYRLNNQTFADLPVYESKRRLVTSSDEAVTLTGTSGSTIDANTFENGTFYSVDTSGAGTFLNFPPNFGNQYLTIETKLQSGVRSYQVARSLFVNTIMYRVKTAASAWSAWVFITQRTATLSHNPPSLAPAEVAFVDVAFVGVALGDCVTSSFSLPLQGVRQWAEVAEAGKVKVYFKNETATIIDLASGTITVKLI